MAAPAFIFVGPVAPDVGDTYESILWVDTTTNIFKRYDGAAWIPLALTTAGSGARSLGQVSTTVTKGNIGTSYVPIYTTTFTSEHLLLIDFTGIFEVRVVFLWNRIGSGTQQARWVDTTNPANVLVESAGFTTAQDPGDTGWVPLPAAFLDQTKPLQMQGKSTVAGDDPVVFGYLVFGR